MRSSPMFLSMWVIVHGGALHAAPPAAEHHDHALHVTAPAQAPAERWATDAPLREGMAQVRAALDELRHHEMGHMGADQARERAVAIEDAIQSMFAHCKLAPQPDAALHAILVPLLAAAQRLDKDPADKAAVTAMREAVAPYAKQFDDPQWPAETKAASAHGEHAH